MEAIKNNTIEKEKITDSFNFFSMSTRKNNSYNYEKIAKNIRKINEMMYLHLSESELKGVETKISQFIECKTKGQSNESKVKKSIRNKYQKFLIAISECEDAELKKKMEMQDKKLCELLF